jgi:hypothetical protein
MKRTFVTYAALCLFTAAILISGCATVNSRPIPNQEDQEFMRLVWEEPLEFELPAGEAANIAWNRAQVFVAKYGTTLNMVEDFLIQTTFPVYARYNDSIVMVRYAVTRLNENNKSYFSVSAYAVGAQTTATLNGKMLVRYMKSGDIRPHLVAQDFDIGSIINPSQP